MIGEHKINLVFVILKLIHFIMCIYNNNNINNNNINNNNNNNNNIIIIIIIIVIIIIIIIIIIRLMYMHFIILVVYNIHYCMWIDGLPAERREIKSKRSKNTYRDI